MNDTFYSAYRHLCTVNFYAGYGQELYKSKHLTVLNTFIHYRRVFGDKLDFYKEVMT